MKNTLKSFLFGIGVGALGFLVLGATQDRPVAPQYDYKLVEGTVYGGDLTLAHSINKEVPAGWELVEVHPSNQHGFAVLRKPKRP